MEALFKKTGINYTIYLETVTMKTSFGTSHLDQPPTQINTSREVLSVDEKQWDYLYNVLEIMKPGREIIIADTKYKVASIFLNGVDEQVEITLRYK